MKYAQGCYGLVWLRLGKDPYDPSNSFFLDVKDAIKKAKKIGDEARIFAIQYDGPETWKKECSKEYPSQGVLTEQQRNGNHAIWHATEKGGAFWEWLSGSWAGYISNWAQKAREKNVLHSRNLPSKKHTVYGVVTVPPHRLGSPWDQRYNPTPAPN
jgi:hypothetical protein